MPDPIDPRIDAWLARNPDPLADPIAGMAEAGLLAPAPGYAAIARTKAALVQRTGLLGVGGVWSGRQMVGRWFIAGFGTPAQQAAWLGKAASVAISEPKVGAHPKLLTTRAERDGTGWRITGEKAWVSNGPLADVIVVLAITTETDGRKQYSAFLVPRDTPGLSMQDMPGFHALRPSRHCALHLDACRVPAEALLGRPGSAYPAMAMPFRDVEDAVGTFGTLGALRFLLPRLGRGEGEADLSLGGLVASTAVYAAAAESLVQALDAGRLDDAAATLVGLRLLAGDLVARIRTHTARFGGTEAEAVQALLADLDATFGVARGPRQVRQARLAETAGQGT